MAYSSANSSSSTNYEVSNDSNCCSFCLECVKDLKEQNEQLVKDLRTARVSVVSYKTSLESVEARLLVFKKNESVYEEDIKLLKRKVYLRDLDITELKMKLELAIKEKGEVNTVKGIRVNTARPKAVLSAVNGNNGNAVKALACWVWRPKHKGNPQQDLKDKGVIDSGCSRHMTGNRSYLTDYEEIDGGFVAFGGNSKGGKITGKGKIRTGKLDFEDVYFVKELKFNLFSVSQMCDKKNSVLFTDTACVVLSPDFKLTDENHVLLKVPRKDNMYSVDLKNVVPQGGLTCLFAKAIPDESNLWHRRLGHVNFKIINKLVRGNLVRGLPSKLFEINQTCVACQKGKQHRASCRKPALSLMRPFGCPVTILNTIDHLDKFDGKADEGLSRLFGNNQIARIMGYDEYQLGNVIISRVYYVEALGHNLFSVGQFCDADLEGKAKKSSHQPKAEDTNQEKLYLLHMDLCGPMRVASINGKRYILVIVDDYSRFTWVRFLKTKDEAPAAIIKFTKNIQVCLKATVQNVRTNNRTEFVNQTLREWYENVGITHQTFVARTPQQNGVVERRNWTLVEAARTMLIFSKALLFLWAEAINTACCTQNRSLIRLRYNKTPYSLMQDKKPDVSFFHVFGSLCYPTNNHEDLGKFDAKADIGIFVGYAPARKAFRIYNRRTQLITKTIHVTFDELTIMASEQFSSGPGLQGMTPATSSTGLGSNPVSQQPCMPPIIQEAAALRAEVLADSPVSTSIDQDAP
ncbi:retrovirus-related pol polyprotein from transposon TNT 1-94 [Tanacetum coccineum]